MAVATQESMPPLRSTTACLGALSMNITLVIYSAVRGSCSHLLLLNTLGSRIPDKLVQLQSKPHRQFVRENPFDQSALLQSLPLPLRVVKYGGKKHRAHSLVDLILHTE